MILSKGKINKGLIIMGKKKAKEVVNEGAQENVAPATEVVNGSDYPNNIPKGEGVDPLTAGVRLPNPEPNNGKGADEAVDEVPTEE